MHPRIRGPIRAVFRRLGYDIVKRGTGEVHALFPIDLDDDDRALYERVKPYTLTSPERVMTLRDAVRYLVGADIPGAIVECGVWKGGSMLVVIDTLLALGVRDRDLYLFDTFTTMPPPDGVDVDVWGTPAADYYDAAIAEPFYFYEQEAVERLVVGTGYPEERIHVVKGMVEDTIPEHAPHEIALCRLDTDWYASTIHELRHLVPRIPEGGVLLIDDYGHFAGARQAVDEYFDEVGVSILLNRIDYSGRLVVLTERVESSTQRGRDSTRKRGVVQQ